MQDLIATNLSGYFIKYLYLTIGMRGLSTSPPLLPIYSSIHLNPRAPVATSPEDATLLALSRQTAHLQETLQSLLDSQSNGLLAGLGRAPAPPSTGRRSEYASASSSPARTRHSTPASIRSTSVSTERPSSIVSFEPKLLYQPRPRSQPQKLSLQASRRGITSALNSLAAVKSQEAELFDAQSRAKESQLRETQSLARKKQGIEDAIRNISHDPEHGNAALESLEAEEKTVIAEIRSVEDRLMELRARERRIHQAREQMSSRLGAKLSSWQNALRDVDKKIQQALSSYDVRRSPGGKRSTSPNAPREYTLSTLEESLKTQASTLQTAQSAAAHESTACIRGAQTWTLVIHAVNKLESSLRDALHRNRHPEFPLIASPNQEDIPLPQQELVGHFDDAILTLEDALVESEEQGWSLLMVAIGAELEALKEGKEMLRDVIGVAEDEPHFVIKGGVEDRKQVRTPKTVGEPLVQVSSSPAGLDLPGLQAEEDEDEDDGPGPELLISHLGDE